MGRRGPLPKNPALKVLSGKAPLTKAALQQINEPFSPPTVPTHFSVRERAVWDETIKLLQPLKVLKNTDSAVLGAYCSAYVRWQDAEKEIQKTKTKQSRFMIKGKDGKSHGINPLISISRDAEKDMLHYATMLSMTPAARLKMVTVKGKDEEKNPFEKLKEQK